MQKKNIFLKYSEQGPADQIRRAPAPVMMYVLWITVYYALLLPAVFVLPEEASTESPDDLRRFRKASPGRLFSGRLFSGRLPANAFLRSRCLFLRRNLPNPALYGLEDREGLIRGFRCYFELISALPWECPEDS